MILDRLLMNSTSLVTLLRFECSFSLEAASPFSKFACDSYFAWARDAPKATHLSFIAANCSSFDDVHFRHCDWAVTLSYTRLAFHCPALQRVRDSSSDWCCLEWSPSACSDDDVYYYSWSHSPSSCGYQFLYPTCCFIPPRLLRYCTAPG